MDKLIRLEKVQRIGNEAFARESEGRLSADHLEVIRAGEGCSYMGVPSAGDWIPVVGYAPDQKTHHEVGYFVIDPEVRRAVVLVRFLIRRTEGGAVVHAVWYPKDRRPDHFDIIDITVERAKQHPPIPDERQSRATPDQLHWPKPDPLPRAPGMLGMSTPSEEAAAIHARLEVGLRHLENLIAIFQDGITNWDERLPPFQGTPRRWHLDDYKATTVGEVLRSRYGGYDWWVVEQMVASKRSLSRAMSHGRMSDEQERRYRRCLELFLALRPEAIARGLDRGWR